MNQASGHSTRNETVPDAFVRSRTVVLRNFIFSPVFSKPNEWIQCQLFFTDFLKKSGTWKPVRATMAVLYLIGYFFFIIAAQPPPELMDM